MFLIDSHCHFDALSNQNINEVMANAWLRDVKYSLAVATSLKGYENLRHMLTGRNDVSLSCGVHPLELSNEEFQPELFKQLAAESAVVALGETGLDYHYQKDNWLLQQAVFSQHIQVGRELKKPVIVHTRDAKQDTLAILKQEKADDCGGVLHCYTEDIPMAKALLDLGFYISFSGIVTFRNAEQLRDVARFVPLDRILVETDSPYLAPVPYRGKENQPAYVREVAEYLAILKGIELNDFAAITTANFCNLFKVDLVQLSTKVSR